ncbi:citrate lyase subunit beta/citryl-CoA lyase [Bradyrhizobium sp. SBR1B]|nr:citrate lyase subunit beta/citryl-CoA lyase [Bradyrhizobium sp. SBR1B]
MRSMLFVPGDSPRKFEKASEGKADALIIDLEDSVVTEKKAEARGLTLTMLKGRPGPHQLYVRVNALDTGITLADLAAVMPGKPDGIVLPKSQGGDDVRQVATWLEALEAAAGTELGSTRIVCVATETAGSIFGLGSYKGCSPRLAGLMWGAEDLSASLGATEKASGGVFHSPYRLARDLCLMAAAAAEVAPIDTVYTDIDNLAGLNTRGAPRRVFRQGADPSQACRRRQRRLRADRSRTHLGGESDRGVCQQSQFRNAAARRPDDRQAASSRREEDPRPALGQPGAAAEGVGSKLRP